MKLGSTSYTLSRIAHVARYFSPHAQIGFAPWWLPHRSPDAYVGWGNRPSGLQAKRIAARKKLPCYQLEYGFIRSLGLQGFANIPLSLIIDDTGIYYDAREPSALEDMIDHKPTLGADEQRRVQQLINHICEAKISKYNHASELDLDALGIEQSGFVLLVDQTFDDASVKGGMASAESFSKMLEDALAKHPNKQIVVKTHPEVISGKKHGYLACMKLPQNVKLVSKLVNPWSLIEHVSDVYVVTSQLGFEALLAGKKVHCYGMPFYAGWGLTHDQLTCPRRIAKPTLEALFYVSYLEYTRYVNPFTQQRCELEDILPIITLWRNMNEQNKAKFHVINMSWWKKNRVRQFLRSTHSVPKFHACQERALQAAKRDDGVMVAWSSKKLDIQKACHVADIPLMRVEDGFVRSNGLGAKLVEPNSLVFDTMGIYYNAQEASQIEKTLEKEHFSAKKRHEAQQLIARLVDAKITKYNEVESPLLSALPKDKTIILVPGQVEADASIRYGCSEVATNVGLLEIVRETRPNAYIIYKPHPDVAAGLRPGAVTTSELMHLADEVVENVSILELIEACDEVHTMTSLTGFEALLRNKTVHCYGMPFYAGWGLTEDRMKVTRRTKKRSLEELVAASLLCYPRYVHPPTGLWCSAHQLLDYMEEPQLYPTKTGLYVAIRTLLGKLNRSMTKA